MKSVRILLVEDHQDTSTVMSRLLGQEGYAVSVAHTVAEAKRLCAAQTFDLLICDLELPDGDGMELLSYARQNCDAAGVVLSAHGSEEVQQAALAAGFAEFIVKPVKFQHLIDAIQFAMYSSGSAARPVAGNRLDER